MEKDQGGYYAVIPARVLMSPELSVTAKLVYGMISARLGETGYCWASNTSLGEALQRDERTVSRAVAELVDAGEVLIEIVGTDERKGHRERRLYTRESAAGSVDKNVVTGHDKNVVTLNRIDNKSPNYPPEPPTGGMRVPEPAKWMPERFEAFWAWYRQNVNPANRAAARKAWDKLRPDEETIRQIGLALRSRLKTDAEWSRGIGLPHASTYLNGQMWLDDGPTARTVHRTEDETPKEAFGEWY